MSVSGYAFFYRRGHQRRVIIDMLRCVKGRRPAQRSLPGTGLSPQVVTSLVDGVASRRPDLVKVGRRPSVCGQPPVDLALNLGRRLRGRNPG